MKQKHLYINLTYLKKIDQLKFFFILKSLKDNFQKTTPHELDLKFNFINYFG